MNQDAARTPRGDRTRTQILDAAEALFGEHPFDAVSMRDIVRQAGVALASSATMCRLPWIPSTI